MQVYHIARTLGVHIITSNYSASCLVAYNASTRGIERMELAHYSERSYTMTHTAPSNPSDPLPFLSFYLTYLSLTYTLVRIRSPANPKPPSDSATKVLPVTELRRSPSNEYLHSVSGPLSGHGTNPGARDYGWAYRAG